MLTTITTVPPPNTEPLSVTDSSGRQISLLNNEPNRTISVDPGFHGQPPLPPRPPNTNNDQYTTTMFDISRSPPPSLTGQTLSGSVQQIDGVYYPGSVEASISSSSSSGGSLSRRKYHCNEPGCNKSFTTSGHLARHNRIHTGEKNFPCLFPGCQSRFSRQDNMMQHYRTHMSPKSRRSHKRIANGNSASSSTGIAVVVAAAAAAPRETRPRPRLHAHHRILSGRFGVEPPLTIDQHLTIYRRSLVSPTTTSERLSSIISNNDPASSSSSSSTSRITADRPAIHHIALSDSSTTAAAATTASTSTLAAFSSPSVLSHHHEDAGSVREDSLPAPPQSTTAIQAEGETKDMFYQHRPLTFPADASGLVNANPSSTTLLGPSNDETRSPVVLRMITDDQNRNDQQEQKQENERSTSSPDSLLQLAYVVSSFG